MFTTTSIKQIALFQILLLSGQAQTQAPPGPDLATLAEGYLLQASQSVKDNAPLEDTLEWVAKMEDAATRAQPKDETSARALAATIFEGQRLYAERRNAVEALMARIHELMKQKKLETAKAEARKAPKRKAASSQRKVEKHLRQARFDEVVAKIDKDRSDALEYVKQGDELAAIGSCHDGSRVRNHYAKAQALNIEVAITKEKIDKIPGPCPPTTCGGKCKATLVLLGVAAGGAAGLCVYDSRRGKSCLDRVR